MYTKNVFILIVVVLIATGGAYTESLRGKPDCVLAASAPPPHCPRDECSLLDDLVGAGEHGRWHVEAKRFRDLDEIALVGFGDYCLRSAVLGGARTRPAHAAVRSELRIAFARQGDHGFRECLAHFVGVVLVCYEGRCSCGNIRQCTELVCADGCQHGDDRPFRTRACQFFGRIPAHEAETVREQRTCLQPLHPLRSTERVLRLPN